MKAVEDAALRDGRPRLHFLDGLRGLAALYVLLFHAVNPKGIAPSDLSAPVRVLYAWLNHGRLSVVFFIVLSGFSLMLPVARSASLQMSTGLAGYIRRRARRILPPYYAALVLSIAMIVVFNVLGPRLGFGGRIDPAALTPGAVISHLALFHNLSFDWVYRINGPMWSVATEWQIYFVFALLLLPFWRKVGGVAGVSTAWILGALPFYVLPRDENFFWACPWFVGSFALGMWGAVIGFAPTHQDSWLRNRAPWALVSVAAFAFLVAIIVADRPEFLAYPVIDFVVSLVAFSLINACVQSAHTRPTNPGALKRFLDSNALAWLGGFSYSVYLIQHPLLRLTEKAAEKLPLDADAVVLLHLGFAVPLVLAAAWLFAEFFEKPFTSGGVLLPLLRARLTRRSSS
jgi:peptidoglycan/LPS O-acetylase OafA/YrhL